MGWFRRLRGTMLGGRVDRTFDDEARFHIDELADEYVRRGMSPEEARHAAQRRFGNVTLARERTRDADTFRWLSDAAQDTRFAFRVLRKNPAFAIVAILTLGIGTGANTAVFSITDATLLNPLPYPDPDRLVIVNEIVPIGPAAHPAYCSGPVDYQSRPSLSTASRAGHAARSARASASRSVQAVRATASLFRVLRRCRAGPHLHR
jgi:hypothetical protein